MAAAHMDTTQTTSAHHVLTPHIQISQHITSSPFLATPFSQIKTHKWPDWLKTWHSGFSVLLFGDTWHKLIAQWVDLEWGYGFDLTIKY